MSSRNSNDLGSKAKILKIKIQKINSARITAITHYGSDRFHRSVEMASYMKNSSTKEEKHHTEGKKPQNPELLNVHFQQEIVRYKERVFIEYL